MKVLFQNALSLYLTGSISRNGIQEPENTYIPTEEELSEWETTKEDWENLNQNSFKFSDQTLSQCADWDTLKGNIRNAELSIFDSLFSGLGATIADKLNFSSGLTLALASIFTSLISTIKKIPFLSVNFSFNNFGGRLIRSSLHLFDSIFSQIGEKGSKLKLPSLFAGGVSLFGLGRVLTGKDNKKYTAPISTIGGTFGRTAIHHMESMLASKANEFSNQNESLSAFLATSGTTLGLLLPRNLKDKELPYQTIEGLFSLAGPHFLDSLFSNIGNAFSPALHKPKNLLLTIFGTAGLLPILSKISKFWDMNAPNKSLGGKLIRSIFKVPEVIAFNAGTFVGKSILGMPLSLAFLGLTGLTKFNFKLPMSKISGLSLRLPFDFINSMISASGTAMSKFIPAPLLVLFGPAFTFKLSNAFKGIDAKYDESKGSMLRSAAHLWESVLSSAAYRTGKMIGGLKEEIDSTGSLLADGRWITNDGQIVLSMANGKQIKHFEEKNIFNILISSIGGIAFGLTAFFLGKQFMKGEKIEQKQIENKNIGQDAIQAVRKPTVCEYPKPQIVEAA